jgi:hypothetical protein
MFHVKQINQSLDVSRETFVARAWKFEHAPTAPADTVRAHRDHVFRTTGAHAAHAWRAARPPSAACCTLIDDHDAHGRRTP